MVEFLQVKLLTCRRLSCWHIARLKGPSLRIRFALKWYSSIRRRWTFKILLRLSLNFYWAFKDLKKPTLNTYQVFFFGSRYFPLDGLQNSLTCQNLFHTNALPLFVSYWLNVWLCQVSIGGGCSCRCNRILASVTFSALNPILLKWQNSCTSHLLITSRAIPVTCGDWQEEIRSRLMSILIEF